RRRQAREEGQVVKSQDLTSAAMLMAAVGTLYWLGNGAVETLSATLITSLSASPMSETAVTHFDSGTAVDRLLFVAQRLALTVVPMMAVMFIAGILINVSQVGLLLSPKKLAPKLSHISPLSGTKRLFSTQAVAKLGFGFFKVLVIAWIAYLSIIRWQDPVLTMAEMSVPMLARTIFDCLIGTCLWVGAALLILALLEYAFQWWKHEQDLKMTDEEVRKEMKESEGDPLLKMRRRQIQQQLVMQRAANEVPSASVVVTNPTELSVAIKYEPETMPAPMIVAKGAGVVAQRIRRLALEHGVPIVERKPLAQILYKTVDVGDSIPTEQYQAVAEVLRYVYQLQGKTVPGV
ncbi:MAG: EscU/YscU/HrcU family type III secretion system export apparatus switch protein, partial [Pirellulaceae bacterium]